MSILSKARTSKRGRHAGPTLDIDTCQIGAKVRVTASTGLMAGLSGFIVGGEGSARPTIRFKGGKELSIPMRKLQLLQKASGDAPIPAPAPQLVRGRNPKHSTTPTDAAAKADLVDPEPLDVEIPEEEEVLVEPAEVIKRDDADWNF